MTQNDLNFIQAACDGRIDAVLQEIVDNDAFVRAAKAQAKKNEKSTEVEKPKKSKETKKGEN